MRLRVFERRHQSSGYLRRSPQSSGVQAAQRKASRRLRAGPPLQAISLRRYRHCLPSSPIGRSGPPNQDYARLHLAYTFPLDILRDLIGATVRCGRGNDY
eukprot:6171820-Pleurochrysis_carterae.AAC.2